jgi:hypothetical protein
VAVLTIASSKGGPRKTTVAMAPEDLENRAPRRSYRVSSVCVALRKAAVAMGSWLEARLTHPWQTAPRQRGGQQ